MAGIRLQVGVLLTQDGNLRCRDCVAPRRPTVLGAAVLAQLLDRLAAADVPVDVNFHGESRCSCGRRWSPWPRDCGRAAPWERTP